MEIIPTTMAHILDMEQNITQEDLNEFHKYRTNVLKDESISLLDNLIQATIEHEVFTMIHDSLVIAIGGEFNGCVWFLTSNELAKQDKETKKDFIRVMNEHKERVLDETGYIWNFIWEGNLTHINFLKMMGATFPEIDYEVPDEFIFFMIKRK